MTSENIMKERWEQLGLPPMELAESSENSTRDNNNGLYKCLLPSLHKLVMMLLLTIFGIGTYVLLLRLSENSGYAKNTEIIILTDLAKRESSPNSRLDNILESIPHMHLETREDSPFTNAEVLPHSHSVPPQHLSETCLLARLLKQKYPHAKEIYDPTVEYLAQHYDHQSIPQRRYFSPGMHAPYIQERDMDLQSHKIHPQDVDILMSLLTSKSEPTATKRGANSTREIICQPGTIPCVSGDTCVDEKQWCDGNVDCLDVSDEAKCTCKSRVDKSRLCDGYFDCPFGEDEMGCHGCSETMFSCENLDINARSTCFTKEQRCNNVVDCPNHKDEVECNMLAPSLLKKPLFAISNTEGFLHRNFKGDWYAVCKNPYMWAHDACRRETGLIIRPPFIQIVPIDPMMKIHYLNTGPGGLIQTSDTCMNSSAVYVTCPDLLCGTRVQSTSQLLRENAAIESHLFGRNKRFLLENHPYPLIFYGNRMKRDVGETNIKTNDEIKFDRLKKEIFGTMRTKRTESRVVGGKPSQPAAWPWMVAVYRNGMFHCGGVVITHSWVVSAAHCVHKFWDHYYEVQVGMLRRFSFSPQEQSHRVTHVIVNPHYSQNDMKNDLSLLKVEPAIQFSRWVRPICLPSPDTAGPDWLWGPAPGTICTSVGWGATTEHGPDPDHMREVEVPIWANCKHREDRAGNEICAGLAEGGKDACQGDSGGPLLCRNPLNSQQWYMAGIVSHGDGCARKDEPGVYTRVSLFVKWIKYHISSKSLPKFQPKQECPGFKCKTGISKCLPNKRKCDKIVDCLDGEDETKCDFDVSSLTDSIFVDQKNSLEELLEKKALTEPTSSTGTNKTQENTTTRNIHSDDDISTTQSENDKTITSTEGFYQNDQTTVSLNLQSEELKTINTEKRDNEVEKNVDNFNNDPGQSKEMTDTKIIELENKENLSNHLRSKQSNSDEKANFKNDVNLDGQEQSTELTDTQGKDFNNERNLRQTKKSADAEETDNKINDVDHLQSNSVSPDTEKPNLQHEKNLGDHSQKPDFEHASTLEIINNESLESLSISEENATADPISTISRETTSLNRGDSEMITLDFSSESLESGASVLEHASETTTQKLSTEPENNSFVDESITTKENQIKLETSTSVFTHNDFIEPINNDESTTPAIQKNVDHLSDKVENGSSLIIPLLPNLNATEFDQETTETNFPDNDTTITVSHPDKGLEPDNSIKQLPEFNSKIEDFVFSELEPPKTRRRHRVPSEFACRRIEQTIPYQFRCDRKADCEDGTDELECTCTDYLYIFDEKLICDGVIDCADGQDESECFSCPEDYFLCKKSRICLPEKHVCDGKPECPQGEDELNCFALTNGKEIGFDIDDRPMVNLEGYLTKKHLKDWHVVCDDNLSIQQQEEAATHICRYLGFSSANTYNVKYINLKEDEIAKHSLDMKRFRRDIVERIPVHFAYRHVREDNDTARHTIIKEPQVIQEQCVPNITKTCKSLYVFCDNSLFTNFDNSESMFMREAESVSEHTWPWIAKVFVEGDYRCTGILVNLSWVLVSDSCLWDSTLTHHYITVVLGSHRTLGAVNSVHEQVYQVDSKKDVYRSKASLLHLREPAHYSNVVKPMVVASSYSLEQQSTCVAVGQDNKNETISVFLEETSENCHPSNRCFKRKSTGNICPTNVTSHGHWAGIISCHTEQGWYPAASFVDGRGECGLRDVINATDIENLKNEIKHYYGKKTLPSLIDKDYDDDCTGVRCGRGRCVPLLRVCDGVRDCEDGNDEAEAACDKKHKICDSKPYHKGCECSVGQMKCHNGKCISKELFRDGKNDCGDGTDEPGQTICKDYLATVMPSRLCDGILHCHDRSDEDPAYCKCFAKKTYKCGSKSDVDHCVALDTICDGVRDCPNGEDEQTCMALNAPHGTPYGTGQVIVRSHGVWHSKCYATPNHTKSELEAICSELGFFSGHAKQIKEMENFVVHPYNNLVVDPFNEIILNNNTVIKMRNTHEPLAKAVFDEGLQNCYPVFIECR
ncbi:hypothetical protein PYW08_001544 [Mythimna loreyi]|uniref:Uncharacterized protein n=1 Tax=Mythimna loreyi TaxID=667449 RepID=A0ACC2R4Y9_9NEOP|nr:hypothetical protein PYW08_001544 [Mythimna loreyi]